MRSIIQNKKNEYSLSGKFINGRMIEASPAIVSYRNVSSKGLLTMKFTIIEGEKLRYCPSSATELGGQTDVRDAYEDSMTYLAPSSLTNAGDGLFSRDTVATNTLLSFYHGLNVPYGCDYSQELFAFDDEKKLLNNVYKIKIDSNDTYYIDIPLEIGQDTSLYKASFGHKVNHSFKPNCR